MTREEALRIINSIDRNILTDKECYVVDNISELVEPSLPADIDEAAEEYSNVHYYETMLVGDLAEGFKAGAEWQKNKDKEIIEVAEDHAFMAGSVWQEEQMLKNAVEGVVHYFGETQGVPRSITIPQMQEWLKPFGNGDKVKIIIIKED